MENAGNVKVTKFTSQSIRNVTVNANFYKFSMELNVYVLRITNLLKENVWSAVIINFMTALL